MTRPCLRFRVRDRSSAIPGKRSLCQRASGGRGEAAPLTGRFRSESGQSTVEWVGLVMLVALLFAAAVAVGVRVPGAGVGGALFDRLLCAAGAEGRCSQTLELSAEYGSEVAGLLEEHAPTLSLGPGIPWDPTDFRECTDRACAERRTGASDPIAFTRVIDCRGKAVRGDVENDGSNGGGSASYRTVGVMDASGLASDAKVDAAGGSGLASGDGGLASVGGDADNVNCTGKRDGNLYLTYWFYYPESSTFDGVPVLQEHGFHVHDWESYQVRIKPNGDSTARASSHRGNNHTKSLVNWASDAGLDSVNAVLEDIGARPRGGWGKSTGTLEVTPGSHAGNVGSGRSGDGNGGSRPDGAIDGGTRDGGSSGGGSGDSRRGAKRSIGAEDLRLTPLEPIAEESFDLPDFAPIAPPWEKAVWADPELNHTG